MSREYITPYLIQRGKINTQYNVLDRISNAVKMDYMGSAEFEYGALPKSLRSMQENKDKMIFYTSDLINKKNEHLIVYGNIDQDNFNHYIDYIKKAANFDFRLKESIGMDEQINGFDVNEPHFYPINIKTKTKKQEYLTAKESKITDFWWDIENGLIMSFNKDFMDKIPCILQSSWNYMDLNK